MRKKFRLAQYRWAPGRIKFLNYRGYSQSHSRKIAFEGDRGDGDFTWDPGPTVERGSITYNPKGGTTRYGTGHRVPK